ncbi:unnamed protein product [Peniophora sp. CBMAI 1063]|nr:unnamed protein product [Peniophora sp. CBMAI 1063]
MAYPQFARTPSRRASMHSVHDNGFGPASFDEPFYPAGNYDDPYQQQDYHAYQPPPGVMHGIPREHRAPSPVPYHPGLSPSPSPSPPPRTPFHPGSGVSVPVQREPTPFHPAYDEGSLEESPLMSEPETYFTGRTRSRSFSAGPYGAPPLGSYPSQHYDMKYPRMPTPAPGSFIHQVPVVTPPLGMPGSVPMSMVNGMAGPMVSGMMPGMSMSMGTNMRTGSKIKFVARGAGGKSGVLLSEVLDRGRHGVEMSKRYRYRYYNLRLSARGLLYVRIRWNGYPPLSYEIPVTVTSGDYVSMSGLARRLGRAVLHYLQSNGTVISSKRILLHRLEEETPGVWLPIFSTI